jgi:Terminase large subunit, T4likevirus-type, N-terminal
MKPGLTILEACDDPAVFGQHFKNADTWSAWRVFLQALFGVGLNETARRLFRKCTGRERPAKDGYTEAWLVIGRRGGKSFTLAVIAVFLAAFRDWRPYLGPGERATVMVIAADRKQARTIMRYVKGLLQSVPMLAKIIEDSTRETINLQNRVTIEVHTASFRSTRGYTIVAALCDELAFWATEDAAEPDYEVINAIRPGMATIPGAMLLCASSPYARKGALWEAHHKHFGKEGDRILVWQADTRTMNPSVPQHVIDEAMEADPASAQAEYGAEFRTDVEGFVTREAVEACISPGERERPPQTRIRYVAFCDPSGGQSDSMTLAIGHKDGDLAFLDCVREVRARFSPEAVTAEFATTLKSYRITSVQGDRYAGEWPIEQFKKRGIVYEPAAKPKSELYKDFLPYINSRRCDLLDLPRLVQQLVALERRTARGGRDTIDHPPGAHDDVANAVAGVIGRLISGSSYSPCGDWVDGPSGPSGSSGPKTSDRNAEWRRMQLMQHIYRTSGRR